MFADFMPTLYALKNESSPNRTRMEYEASDAEMEG